MVGMSGAARPRASSFAVFSSDARRWVFFFPGPAGRAIFRPDLRSGIPSGRSGVGNFFFEKTPLESKTQ